MAQQLVAAAKRGDLAKVERLLANENRDDLVNAKDRDGWMALHVASWEGHLRVVQHLLGRGADVHAKNSFGSMPLHEACCSGRLNVVQCLLENGGANVNAKNNDGNTPLHSATLFGRLEVVRYLLEHGANVNAKDNRGKKPIELEVLSKDGPNRVAIKNLLAANATGGEASSNRRQQSNTRNRNARPSNNTRSSNRQISTEPTRSSPAAAAPAQRHSNRTQPPRTRTAGDGKTPAQLFLSSPIFGTASDEAGEQPGIGAYVVQLEIEAASTAAGGGNPSPDADALRGLGYCYDRGIEVEQDPHRAMDLYLQADRVASSSFSMTTAAWLCKIQDPRVTKFGTHAELDHHLQHLRQLVDDARASIDVIVLQEAACARKEVAVLERLCDLDAFQSVENLRAKIEELAVRALETDDFDEKVVLAKQIEQLQEQCRQEEEKQASLGMAVDRSNDSAARSTPRSAPQHPPGRSGPQPAGAPTRAPSNPRGFDNPFDVFLVHTGAQKRTEVAALKRALSTAPDAFQCFLDQDDLTFTSGSPTQNMRQSLERCRYAVAVVSREFLQRKNPCAELAYTIERMQWLREQGLGGSWESLCVILCNITVEEFKRLCRSSPVPIPPGLENEVTMVLWDSRGCRFGCWDDVCQYVKQRIVAHDQAGAMRNWSDFLEQRNSNNSTPLSPFPTASGLYK